MNKVILIGRLTKDPQTRSTQSGILKEIEDAGLRMRFCGKNAMDMAKEIARL